MGSICIYGALRRFVSHRVDAESSERAASALSHRASSPTPLPLLILIKVFHRLSISLLNFGFLFSLFEYNFLTHFAFINIV